MHENDEFSVTLLDDGTMDTVVEVTDKQTNKTRKYRYDLESACEYRDENTGCLDFETFCTDIVFPDAACDEWDD